MPSDDLILNVRQITQYPPLGDVPAGAAVVLQTGGIGGPYASASVANLISTGLSAASDPLMVGYSPPTTGNGGNIITGSISSVAEGGHTFNCYQDTTGALSAFSSGYCGMFDLNQPAGTFVWLQAPSPGAAQPVTLAQTMLLFPTGDLVLSGSVTVARDPAAPLEVATQRYVGSMVGGVQAYFVGVYNSATVWSFNGRTGTVCLNVSDIVGAGGAPSDSPQLTGYATAPTVNWGDCSSRIATTAFVVNALTNAWSGSLAGYAPLDSPAFTGTPTAPTPPEGNNSTALATTAWVNAAVANEIAGIIGAGYAPINSPAFSGVPTAPTAAPGTHTGQIATTSFVLAAVSASTAGVASFNTRTGAVVLTAADITGAGGAPLASPSFTGVPLAPTATPGTNTTQLATCAFVAAIVAGGMVSTFNGRTGAITLATADITGAGGAPLASPGLTGVPLAPTASAGTNTTQIATTGFVAAAISGAILVQSFNSRTGAVTLQANDISAAGGAVLASPAFTGSPTAPTASVGTSNTQIATTAFVTAAIAAQGVTSFNTRTGAITLIAADVSAAGGALLAGPSFTGTPTAPTAAPLTNTTQIATTAFVNAAIGGAVTSFNTRTGAITLATADITGAGGAPLASPSFTGVPLAPTASVGTNSQQVATTAFVASAISAGAVSSFNSRTGAVTLQANDISAAGGALLVSPIFTGTPAGPTAITGTNTTQLATCAFVLNELGTLGGVTSFNGRAGVVTLALADVTGVGGAPIASPTFTGTPAAPTPALSDSSTALATTAFVRNGVTSGANAPAGQIGETIAFTAAASAAVNGAWITLSGTQITLSAGVWDVWGLVQFSPSGAMLTTYVGIGTAIGISPLHNTGVGLQSGGPLGTVFIATLTEQLNVSTSTNVFLNAQSAFTSGVVNCNGWIFARRIR